MKHPQDNMAAFKVLGAVLAICVAQNALFGEAAAIDKPYDVTDLSDPPTFSWVGCSVHIPAAYSLVKDAKELMKEYSRIRNTTKLLKEQCAALADETEKEKCLKQADKTMQAEKDALMVKVSAFIPRFVDLADKFKKCLFE